MYHNLPSTHVVYKMCNVSTKDPCVDFRLILWFKSHRKPRMCWLVESFNWWISIIAQLCAPYVFIECTAKRCQRLPGKCTFCSCLFCAFISLTHNLRVRRGCSHNFFNYASLFFPYIYHIPSSSWILSTLCFHCSSYPWVEVFAFFNLLRLPTWEFNLVPLLVKHIHLQQKHIYMHSSERIFL